MLYFLLTWLVSPWLRHCAQRPPGEPRRVLLIQTAKIGDLVCTTPIIASLKTTWPECQLTVLVNPACAPLLKHDPAVDALWPVPATEWQGLAGKWRLLRRLRAGTFDTCIVLSPNSAFLLLPLWAGIPQRAAMLGNFPSRSLDRCARFLTHVERHRTGRQVLATELALLEQLGIDNRIEHKVLHPAPTAASKVAMLLADRTAPRIGIGISAGNMMKALSAEQLTELCRRLLADLPHDLVLVGTAADRATAGSIIRGSEFPQRIIDASGALALDELPALMPSLAAYFGVDSGVTYIADTFDVPTVDLMGPANADDQRPTGRHAVVLRSTVDCAPCSHAFRAPYHCARGDRACVAGADLSSIVAAVIQVASKAP